MKKKQITRLHFVIEVEDRIKLDAIAVWSGRSRSEAIREMIREQYETLKDELK